MACTLAPQPPRVGLATVTVRLADRSAKAVAGAQINLEGDMAHPGMAPVFAKAKETEPGRYVAHLQLTMAGDWVILVQATVANGRKISRQVDVKGVLPG
ncbi:MAG TPA: FixH family protein [Bryobacteraceae bacterium]|nr:FixH family protein [Bryobacteraceae bacterium]